MKKSCDRIAAVLGLRETSGNTRVGAPQFTNHASLAEARTRDALSDYKPGESNVKNPSGVRHLPTKEEDGQPSGYKSVR